MNAECLAYDFLRFVKRPQYRIHRTSVSKVMLRRPDESEFEVEQYVVVLRRNDVAIFQGSRDAKRQKASQGRNRRRRSISAVQPSLGNENECMSLKSLPGFWRV